MKIEVLQQQEAVSLELEGVGLKLIQQDRDAVWHEIEVWGRQNLRHLIAALQEAEKAMEEAA